MHQAATRSLVERQSTWWALGTALLVGVVAFIVGFQRRWMSDDGLIVLRTVRNLLEGNGPVFNVGERVEANTSTLWQYLITVAHMITGQELAVIALYGALGLSTLAIVIGCWATARLYKPDVGPDAGPVHWSTWTVIPAGVLVYIALPPARDFFTSGLEWGLSIFYLAVLWAVLLWWAQRADGTRSLDISAYLVAFWAGLSWLVRPELALYGGIAGIALFIAHRHWKNWLLILAVALPIPGGYQIFRMGYYGLLTPHTAVAKSASDSQWASGFNYLSDFVGPYWLWLPVLVLAIVGFFALKNPLLAGLQREVKQRPVGKHRKSDKPDKTDGAAKPSWMDKVRTPATAVIVLVGCAILHFLYVLRVGGDFMHGRMFLLPLFALLLPVFVLPLRQFGSILIGSIITGAIALWALVIAYRGLPNDWSEFDSGREIVDEREFWTYATQREQGDPPMNAQDFRGSPFLEGWDEGIAELEDGDAMMTRIITSRDPNRFNWLVLERDETRDDPPTLYLVNMGMSSMNAPLNVRVLDNIGLATPLAARQPRIEDGRVGHDKNLDRIWQVADSGVDLDELPEWVDTEGAKAARAALETEDFQKLFASYREPLTIQRFFDNIAFSLGDGRSLQLSSDPYDYLPEGWTSESQ
ncbi:flagellar motor control protein ZomB [Corynebacterium sp. L4756]|uniref:flagellar motor control protein ZomB n=1 Tax=unclassified Corynebacterium TaxID=2624378 RepID=UPI00374D3E83